mgnify:CR=1 FL=1
MRKFLLAALALSIPVAAQAHEVWIERDGAGPARIYLGEPAETQPEGGDPEFPKLKAPRIVTPARATLARKAGFIEGPLATRKNPDGSISIVSVGPGGIGVDALVGSTGGKRTLTINDGQQHQHVYVEDGQAAR